MLCTKYILGPRNSSWASEVRGGYADRPQRQGLEIRERAGVLRPVTTEVVQSLGPTHPGIVYFIGDSPMERVVQGQEKIRGPPGLQWRESDSPYRKTQAARG